MNSFSADEETVEILHRFRPSFLAKIEIPCYFEPYAFKHTCILQSEPATDLDALTLEDENLDTVTRRKCIALPYVAPDDFGAMSVSEKLKNLIKEVRFENSSYLNFLCNKKATLIVTYIQPCSNRCDCNIWKIHLVFCTTPQLFLKPMSLLFVNSLQLEHAARETFVSILIHIRPRDHFAGFSIHFRYLHASTFSLDFIDPWSRKMALG